MDILKYAICAFALAFAATGSAGAATIDFAQNNAPQAGALSFTNGSETVSVVASRVNGSNGNALIASYAGANGGLGVCTSNYDVRSPGRCNDAYEAWGFGDNYLIDGSAGFLGSQEAIYLDFGPNIIDLNTITFSFVGDGDTFDVISDMVPIQSSYTIAAGASQRTFTFGTPLRGSYFGIGALGVNDNFSIRSLGYDIVRQIPNVPTVPLPATGLLLLGALMGAGLLRRRRTN